ncbi:MAG TPA: hypothetical protein VKO18_01395 [Terriglobia bacterium]|nr:hypothetical protein [Terriglobia bacterium]
MKGWQVIFIKGGDAELTRAMDVLCGAGVYPEAKGWSTDPVPRPRPQIQVQPSNVPQAVAALSASGIRHVMLGPLGSLVNSEARWTDEYPSWQQYADELEEVLNWTKAKGQWNSYLGALQGSNSQRDSALMEIRVAKYLESSGFLVVDWKPQGAGGNEGEYTVEGQSGQRVFVEVKSPGWEGEVSKEERDAGRLAEPKLKDLEARAVASWERIQFAVDKAYKKFRGDTPNFLIIAGDLFISPQHAPELHAAQALYSNVPPHPGYFTDQRYDKLGGVGFFWIDSDGAGVQYYMRVFLNPNALNETALPLNMRERFRAEILDPNNLWPDEKPTPLDDGLWA